MVRSRLRLSLTRLVALLVDGYGSAQKWHLRKQEIIQNHPMYDRILTRSDLSHMAHVTKVAWQQYKTAAHCGRFAYLIQGEEDISALESAAWTQRSDVFALTFRSRRRDALFFPNSLLAEGRNMLVGAAVIEEQRKGKPYMYYVFADGDVLAKPSWDHALPRFESFLREWEPAVGLPSLGAPSTALGPESVFNFDHIFVAVHVEAASSLLPYHASLDNSCAWTSQWYFTLLASALFRHHVLVFHSVVVSNPSHSSYPKDDCLPHMTSVSNSLRSIASAGAKSCFPDAISGMMVLPDRVTHSSYLPWGTAKRKNDVGSIRNYSNVSFSRLSSCDDEVVVKTLQRNSEVSWCPSCTEAEAFGVLQGWIAEDPYKPAHWNTLGIWMLKHQDWQWWTTAATCFLIAERIRALSGFDRDSVATENVLHVKNLFDSNGLSASIFEGSLWEDGSGLGGLITNALALDIDGQMKVLIDSVSLMELIEFLLDRH